MKKKLLNPISNILDDSGIACSNVSHRGAPMRLFMVRVLMLAFAISPAYADQSELQSSSIPVSSINSDHVRLEISGLDGRAIDRHKPLIVDNTVEIIGQITRQPYTSEIRTVIRCGEGEPWRLIEGVATPLPNGEWRLPDSTLLPLPLTGTLVCRLMAIVAPPLGNGVLSEQALQEKAFAASNVVELRIDGRLSRNKRAEVTLTHISGQSIFEGQPTVVPWAFSISGFYSNLPEGSEIIPMISCDRSPDWWPLQTVLMASTGEWNAPQVSLPGVFPGSQCALMVTAATSSIPKRSYTAADINKWAIAQSPAFTLVQRAVYLSIISVVDESGVFHVVDEDLKGKEAQIIALDRDVSTLRIEGDEIPSFIQVYVAVQPEGTTRWFLSGPARSQGSSEWVSDNTRLIMPGIIGASRKVCVIATRDSLYGRVLTSEELQHVALGISDIIHMRAPKSPACTGVQARLTHINNLELAGGETINVQPILQAAGELHHACAGMAGFVAVEVDDRRMQLFPIKPDRNGRWNTTIKLPYSSADPEVRNVTAIGLIPDNFAMELVDESWAKAFAASYLEQQLTLRLPSPPLGVRLSAFLEKMAHPDGGKPDMTVLSNLAAVSLNIIVPILFLAGLYMLLSGWRKLRAWYNGRRDANQISISRNELSPYEEGLIGERDERKAQIGSQLKPKIAALKSRSSALDRTVTTLTRRLQGPLANLKQGIPGALHHICLALLTIGELSFNLVAFRVLQEADLWVFVMSLSVGVAFPVIAYFTGTMARKWQSRTSHVTVLMAIALTALVSAIWAVNAIRTVYLEKVSPVPLAQNSALHFAFIPVNVLVLMAAALLAFLYHDDGYRKTCNQLRRAAKKRDKLNEKISRLIAKLDSKLEKLDKHYNSLLAVYRTAYRRYHQGESQATSITDAAIKNDVNAVLPGSKARQKIHRMNRGLYQHYQQDSLTSVHKNDLRRSRSNGNSH